MKMVFVVILISGFIFAGCSSERNGGDEGVVAQVNDYKMKADDLRYDLKHTPYDEKSLLETKEGRMEYVNQLLEKEVLLQEAQRLGLDREKDFMKSIENYWEQALLRLLLEKKSKEISGFTHVYENEVEEYYRDSGEKLPLSRVRGEIIKAIRQEKESEAMSAWAEELKKRAYIKINEDVLEDVFGKITGGGSHGQL
ncbi:MAG: SurA N-terminal domain-containing protein [Candidatus Omnitrophica bacterium]|nr:SurA N-terminal domain-containing protein [Candidatus Omnitrophota bacterium]MBU1933611.1 SurA N-terminal domain-containing protein [Candidatus Omnitrophota bacterium]